MSWSLFYDVLSVVIFGYFAVGYVWLWRTNKRQQELIEKYALYLDYVVDRLARVEPVPITILDGLGRDISHLQDEVEA